MKDISQGREVRAYKKIHPLFLVKKINSQEYFSSIGTFNCHIFLSLSFFFLFRLTATRSIVDRYRTYLRVCNYLLLACCIFGNRFLGRLVFTDKMNIVSDLLRCDQVGFTRILEDRRSRKFLSGAGRARWLHHHWLTVHQDYGVSHGIVSSWWPCVEFHFMKIPNVTHEMSDFTASVCFLNICIFCVDHFIDCFKIFSIVIIFFTRIYTNVLHKNFYKMFDILSML